MISVAVLNTELANETQNVMIAVTIVIRHFLLLGKFIGFSGSSGPSQLTRWVAGSIHDRGFEDDFSFSDWPASRSMFWSWALVADEDSPWMEVVREGAAVLTAVSGGEVESHPVVRPSSFFRDRDSRPVSGSWKATIFVDFP